MTATPFFSVRNLHLSFADRAHKPLFGPAPRIEVLKGLDLDIGEGRITGIVGESGSGKSTLGRVLVRLLDPDSGNVMFKGQDIAGLDEEALRPLRRDLQMIFQDPMSSLNPRHKVWRIIAQPMKRYGLGGTREQATEALVRVGLPAEFGDRFPHQLSGGQRQRVGIARAIAVGPSFILADEIVSGLDVSSQAHVLMLLSKLAKEMGLTVALHQPRPVGDPSPLRRRDRAGPRRDRRQRPGRAGLRRSAIRCYPQTPCGDPVAGNGRYLVRALIRRSPSGRGTATGHRPATDVRGRGKLRRYGR